VHCFGFNFHCYSQRFLLMVCDITKAIRTHGMGVRK
jgi:hypothetical protein